MKLHAVRFLSPVIRSLTSVAFAATCSLILGGAGCAPSLGPTIEAGDIPPPATQPATRARFGSVVGIQDIRDNRPAPATDGSEKFTEPHGGVPQLVEAALKTTLSDAGVSVVSSAPVEMKVEVLKWRSQVDPKANVMLRSEASLLIELYDPAGKKVFSGTYNGVRSSQFPVVTRVDVKDSLGLAMSNALEQLVADPQFIELVGSF